MGIYEKQVIVRDGLLFILQVMMCLYCSFWVWRVISLNWELSSSFGHNVYSFIQSQGVMSIGPHGNKRLLRKLTILIVHYLLGGFHSVVHGVRDV